MAGWLWNFLSGIFLKLCIVIFFFRLLNTRCIQVDISTKNSELFEQAAQVKFKILWI